MGRRPGSKNKPKVTNAELKASNEAAQTEYREQKKRGRPKKTACNDGHPHGGAPCEKPKGHDGLHENLGAAPEMVSKNPKLQNTSTTPDSSTKDLALIDLTTGQIVGPAKVLDLNVSGRKHYSHSFLKTVAQCSAQAYFKASHAPQRKSFALERGSCVHHLLELFAKEGKDPVKGLPDAWRLYILDHVAEMNEADQEKSAKEYDNTKRMLEEFCYENAGLFKERVRPEDIEVEFNLDVPLRLGDKTFTRKFNGKIDLVLWSEDRTKYRIIDYKGLALDTPIPTPNGWTTMGEIRVGDEVFDKDGKVCRVTHKSEVHRKKCYKITFDDDTSVVCDFDHKWLTTTGHRNAYTSKAGKRYDYDYTETSVKETHEIAARLFGKTGQRDQRIFNTAALDLAEADGLPIHPYLLGCWLGDGNSKGGTIHKPDAEIFETIESLGYRVLPPHKSSERCPARTVEGLTTLLRLNGLQGNKHVPERYLRGSRQQRLDLLRGLMDTDGNWNKIRNQAVFTNTNKNLCDAVCELALSLGSKAHVVNVKGHFNGEPYPHFITVFVPHDFNPFKLKRKAELVRPHSKVSGYRMIVSADEVETVETQCIAVDSPSHTYLCTKQMIPTHNTSASAPGANELALDAQFALYFWAGEQLYGKKASALDYYLLNGVHICHDEEGKSIRFSSKAHPREIGQRKSGCEITYALKVPKKSDEEIAELFNAYYAPLVVKYESGIVAKEGRADVRNRCNLCTFSDHCATVREFPAPRIV